VVQLSELAVVDYVDQVALLLLVDAAVAAVDSRRQSCLEAARVFIERSQHCRRIGELSLELQVLVLQKLLVLHHIAGAWSAPAGLWSATLGGTSVHLVYDILLLRRQRIAWLWQSSSSCQVEVVFRCQSRIDQTLKLTSSRLFRGHIELL